MHNQAPKATTSYSDLWEKIAQAGDDLPPPIHRLLEGLNDVLDLHPIGPRTHSVPRRQRSLSGGALIYIPPSEKLSTHMLENLEPYTDAERDRISIQFTENLDGTNRKREERERERQSHGSPTRGQPGEEEEVGGSDWREDRVGRGIAERRGGKLCESKCPWYRPESEFAVSLTESQRKTRESLEYFREDLGLVLQWVKSAPGGPKHFPDSEWGNLLRGRAIDLGRVLASQYISKPVSENVASVGGVEVRVAGREKVKRIETSSDWQIAWIAAAEATAFVFPHRQQELNLYSSYILQKFRRRSQPNQGRVIYSTEISKKILTKVSSTPMESSTKTTRTALHDGDSCATGSTERVDATSKIAHTNTNVEDARTQGTDNQVVTVPSLMERGLKPKYLRFNRWNVEGEPIPGVVIWSEHADPLPRPPKLHHDHVISQTLRARPDLFKIVTPINVLRFKQLLQTHPNQLFVKSICDGLQLGFWPWAEVDPEGYPATYDQAQSPPRTDEMKAFLREQRDKEVSVERFSAGFGGDLLPVTHQSFGEFSLNSMTPSHDRGFPMDSLVRLGDQLLRLRKSLEPGQSITLWKSDVSEAYRLMPVAPAWQIKQINFIDGKRYVDRCLAFGGRRSGDVFISFMSLVLWIAEHIRRIQDPNGFVDDTFAAQIAGETKFNATLNREIPSGQASMLALWDELRIPYKPHKQQDGTVLVILGIEVNTHDFTFTLPKSKRDELVNELGRFIYPIGKKPNRYPLKAYQTLAGWMNWAFNVYPLLRPSLSHVYEKMHGLQKLNKRVKVTRAISNDLEWARKHILSSDGVFLLTARDWDITEADLVFYTDACLTGIGIHLPSSNLGFWAIIDCSLKNEWIYCRKLWAVVTVIHYAIKRLEMADQKLIIYTDNSNVVDAFNTLSVEPTIQ